MPPGQPHLLARRVEGHRQPGQHPVPGSDRVVLQEHPRFGVDERRRDRRGDATAISSTTSSSYALIAALSHAILPDAPVAPGLVLAGTDSRHYADVAENVYRFQPILLTQRRS